MQYQQHKNLWQSYQFHIKSFIQKGATEGEFELPLYQRSKGDTPHINCLLTPHMYKELFAEECGISLGEALMTSEEYGKAWALRGLLAEKGYGSVTEESEQFDYIYYDVLNPNPAMDERDDDIPWEIHDAKKIKALFGSQEKLDEILTEEYARGGIQIIYQKETFADFLEDQKLPLRPDNGYVDDGAIELFEPVPQGSILAIVPLGEYEEAILFEKNIPDYS